MPRSAENLGFLLRAGDALAASLDYETTLATVAREAVPTIADWCAVDVLDASGTLRRLAVAHPDPDKLRLARELTARYPEDPASPTSAYARIRSKKTDWMAEVPDELLVSSARDAEHLALIRALEIRSFISVPLIAHGEALGLLTLVSAESGRRYTQADVDVAEELARRAALAIDHAHAYQAAVVNAQRLEQQAAELEAQTEQLQDQATELEAQQADLEEKTEELSGANTQLRESEGFARGILDSIADPMVVYDANFRTRLENDAAVRVFLAGGRKTSMIGRVLWEEYPDLIGTAFEREMRRAAETRQPTSFVEMRSGSGVWTEVRCYPLADGGITAVWKDVTAQKRAEETLYYLSRVSDALAASLDYEETVKAVAQLVVPRLADWCAVDLVDAEGEVRQLALTHVDPGKVTWAREINRRFPPDRNAPTGVAQVIRSGKPELYPAITDEMLAGGISNPEHLELLRQVGFTSVLIVPLLSRGRTLGAMTLVTAESGRRYTEADLTLAQEIAHRAAHAVDNATLYTEALEAKRIAENANEAKTAFLAHMSHELRTPLNAIGGYAELLETEVRGPVNAQQRADLGRIQRSQRHLLSLINDVLNYAKLEVGRVKFEISTVSVAAALAELESVFAPQLSEARLSYTLEPVDAALTVSADAEKLQQILLNLVSNAVKFTGPGGTITVSAREASGFVAILVRDTGIGIPAEKQEAIFEPFVQLHVARAVIEGTGLGLSISRDLARGMRGDLTVQSEPGNGSTFTLRLPRP